MLWQYFTHALAWAISLDKAVASANSEVAHAKPRNPSVSAYADGLYAIRRALSASVVNKRDTVLKNSTQLSKSFNGATLFNIGDSGEDVQERDVAGDTDASAGIQIVCTTCYVSGTATVEFTVNGDFNASQAIHSLEDGLSDEISNITSSAISQIETTVKNDFTDIVTLNLDDLQWPTIDLDFDLDIQGIPECQVFFQFDGLELYMELETILSGAATYTLNLYTSETAVGIRVSEDLELGVLFSIDLILGVDAEIAISSGFHVKLEDGIAFSMDMFGNNVSDITFNGGEFEFLPITVASAGVVFSAVLRLGVHAGFEMGEPGFNVSGHSFGSFSTGVEAGVFANVAEITTNISAGTGGCDFDAVEAYAFAVGAAAGATLAVGDHTWGPVPTSTVPIWSTTLGEQCAAQQTSTANASQTATVAARAALSPRQDNLTETTISTVITYTGVACLSTGLVNCPVSLQTTSVTSSESTTITSVSSGIDATWPATTDSVVTQISFGTNAKQMLATSGSPSPFTPEATGDFSKHAGGLTNKEKHIIIGVTVGVGVPVLAAIGVGIFYLLKRRKSRGEPMKQVSQVGDSQRTYVVEPHPAGPYENNKDKPSTNVAVSEST
ncbi:Glycolate oxidase [Pleurostoma richardsiae]|uniref:Glycolate oxidase n=1 Tax=Pleurostoma richardsiae TaxID=41990 RepID=A0AA38VKV4_9PEZI|nr:Glycolate oxidase [Pleurostoma richardsiae]